MRCPFCHVEDTKVIDSRLVGEGDQVRRRRECVSCLERFTTYESMEVSYPRLRKRNGSYEEFHEEKLRSGLLRALEKRPVSAQAVDDAVARILSKLREQGEREIDTQVLGEWVISELKGLDQIAYIRFASVYRQFQDLEEFGEEIARLKNPHE